MLFLQKEGVIPAIGEARHRASVRRSSPPVKRTALDAAGLCAQGKTFLHRGPSMPIASHPHMSVRFGKAELALVAITMIWGTTFLLVQMAMAVKIGRASCRERVCPYV